MRPTPASPTNRRRPAPHRGDSVAAATRRRLSGCAQLLVARRERRQNGRARAILKPGSPAARVRPMLDDLHRFSTDAYPENLRQTAWSAALASAQLRSEGPGAAAHAPLHGYVFSRDTALGTIFLRLSSSPQVLVPCTRTDRHETGSVLVFAVLEGCGTVTQGHESAELGVGSIVLFDPARAWRLELTSRFRALAVRLESATFLLRLVRTSKHDLDIVSGDIGAGAMCVDVVRSIADHLDELDGHDLLAIEATLT